MAKLSFLSDIDIETFEICLHNSCCFLAFTIFTATQQTLSIVESINKIEKNVFDLFELFPKNKSSNLKCSIAQTKSVFSNNGKIHLDQAQNIQTHYSFKFLMPWMIYILQIVNIFDWNTPTKGIDNEIQPAFWTLQTITRINIHQNVAVDVRFIVKIYLNGQTTAIQGSECYRWIKMIVRVF